METQQALGQNLLSFLATVAGISVGWKLISIEQKYQLYHILLLEKKCETDNL